MSSYSSQHSLAKAAPSVRGLDWRILFPLVAMLLALVACAKNDNPMAQYENRQPDASVRFEAVQAAWIGSATGGQGKLTFRGETYPFTIAGAGIGGIGASTVSASGDVYDLRSAADFAGPWGQVRFGFAAGTMSRGELWLRNQNGAVMRLRAERTGLMLSMGGDAMIISLSR